MPNKEGGYGGYRQPGRKKTERRVRAPGAEGGVRRGVTPPPYQPPYTPRPNGKGVRPARYDPNALEDDWVRPEAYTPPAPSPETPPPPRRPAGGAGAAFRAKGRAGCRLPAGPSRPPGRWGRSGPGAPPCRWGAGYTGAGRAAG